MEVSIRVLKTETRRRAAATEIRSLFVMERVFLNDFVMTINIYDHYGNRYEYTGSVFSGVGEIVAGCRTRGELGVLSGGRVKIFRQEEYPILHCIYRSGNTYKIYGMCRLVLLESKNVFPACGKTQLLDGVVLSRLRRVNLARCNIENIPDLSCMELTHLDLSHNNISGPVCLPGVFDVVDVSYNKISSVTRIDAYHLNLSHNSIEHFSQEFGYMRLNLSHNPLRQYSGSARVLDLSYTQVSVVESTASRMLFLDGTKNIRLEKLKNLRFLSLNGCELRSLVFKAKRLRVLKARNNFLETIPHFPNLEHLDVSGNLIYKLSSKRLRFLDVSKNQLIRFDLNDWDQLVYLDISHNPIMEFGFSHMSKCLKFLNLDGTSFKGCKEVSGCFRGHRCDRRNKVVRRIAIDGPDGLYKRFFVITCASPGTGMKGVFRLIQSKISNVSNPLEYFRKFHRLLQRSLFEMDLELEFALVMVTPRHVMSGGDLRAVFSNFAEIRVVGDPEAIYVHDNVGNWNFIPLLCGPCGEISRFDIVDTHRNDLRDVLSFMNYKCPISYRASVSNAPEIYNESVGEQWWELSMSLLSDRLVYEDEIGNDTFGRDTGSHGTVYGSENYNPVLENSMRWCYSSLVTNPNPIFVFCRFVPRNVRDGYRCITGNVRNIVKTMNHIFFGTNLEFFSDFCIVAFNDRVEACVWALRIQSLLSCLQMDVRAGITCGIFYTKIVNNHVRFYGPALIKAVRLAKIGVGVFCCHCVWTKHPRIVYVEHGLRYLRGFKEPHPIYTPQLQDERL